jgi:glycine oxidase
MAGSTLEDSGFDKSTTAAALQALTQRSIQLIPELANASITAHWSGLRPYSDNKLPIVQAHSEVQGLYLNCGHHRYGICMAPYSAEKITQLILK